LSVDGEQFDVHYDGKRYSGAGESLIDLALPPGTPAEAKVAVRRLVELTGILARRCAQLQHALTSRVLIEQAKGILAERYRVTTEQAFEALRRTARSERIKIHDLAKEVIASPFTPRALEARFEATDVRSVVSARPTARIQVHPRS
jgi:hypothetical protein